jgi:hypothetical protein
MLTRRNTQCRSSTRVVTAGCFSLVLGCATRKHTPSPIIVEQDQRATLQTDETSERKATMCGNNTQWELHPPSWLMIYGPGVASRLAVTMETVEGSTKRHNPDLEQRQTGDVWAERLKPAPTEVSGRISDTFSEPF